MSFVDEYGLIMLKRIGLSSLTESMWIKSGDNELKSKVQMIEKQHVT